MRKIICIAGFGDDASMFSALIDNSADISTQFHPISLPGFGAPPLDGQTTSLESLATYLIECADRLETDTVLAHSVASIIASIAAKRGGSPIASVLSLEGNLTSDDAYFSGTAAQFAAPGDFRTAFLNRLDKMAKNNAVIERYRSVVECANPQALWELGCDAHRFSSVRSPGDLLQSIENVTYLFNPENVPERSLLWLKSNSLFRLELPGASHWASVDRPNLLIQRISETLGIWGR